MLVSFDLKPSIDIMQSSKMSSNEANHSRNPKQKDMYCMYQSSRLLH